MSNTASIALTGISSASKRVQASSHNLANLLTDDFHPVRVLQSAEATGGSSVRVERTAQPEPVSVARELIGAELASVQLQASLRVVEIELETVGSLLDILA